MLEYWTSWIQKTLDNHGLSTASSKEETNRPRKFSKYEYEWTNSVNEVCCGEAHSSSVGLVNGTCYDTYFTSHYLLEELVQPASVAILPRLSRLRMRRVIRSCWSRIPVHVDTPAYQSYWPTIHLLTLATTSSSRKSIIATLRLAAASFLNFVLRGKTYTTSIPNFIMIDAYFPTTQLALSIAFVVCLHVEAQSVPCAVNKSAGEPPLTCPAGSECCRSRHWGVNICAEDSKCNGTLKCWGWLIRRDIWCRTVPRFN